MAVKHDYVRSMTGGPDEYDFNGMVYVTFTSRDLVCIFQSYWRSRKMFSSLEVRNAQGYVVQQAQCRFLDVGNCSIVGRYKNHGHRNRTWARWGQDVWAFWPACLNQRVTRNCLNLPPLPATFTYGDREVTITAREF